MTFRVTECQIKSQDGDVISVAFLPELKVRVRQN